MFEFWPFFSLQTTCLNNSDEKKMYTIANRVTIRAFRLGNNRRGGRFFKFSQFLVVIIMGTIHFQQPRGSILNSRQSNPQVFQCRQGIVNTIGNVFLVNTNTYEGNAWDLISKYFKRILLVQVFPIQGLRQAILEVLLLN